MDVLIIFCTNTSFTLVVALEAAKSTSPLVQHCQKALNDISTQHSVALSWFPGHSGLRRDEIADEIAREGTVHHFVALEPALGVSRQNIRKKDKILDGQPAYGNVTCLYQYSETGSKIYMGRSSCKVS